MWFVTKKKNDFLPDGPLAVAAAGSAVEARKAEYKSGAEEHEISRADAQTKEGNLQSQPRRKKRKR